MTLSAIRRFCPRPRSASIAILALSLFSSAISLCVFSSSRDHADLAVLLSSDSVLSADDESRIDLLKTQIEAHEKEATFIDAVPLAKKMHQIYSRNYSGDHWRVIDAQVHLEALEQVSKLPKSVQDEMASAYSSEDQAYASYAQGQYDEALAQYGKAYEIRRKYLGADHPDTAQSMQDTAMLLKVTGEYERAGQMYQEALEILREKLGPDHPDVGVMLSNLGTLDTSKSNYHQAEQYIREGLDIVRKAYGDEHPQVAAIFNNLAATLTESGDYKSAEKLYRKTVYIEQIIRGTNDPHLAMALGNWASCLTRTGDLSAAESLLRRSHSMALGLLGNQNPMVATFLNNIAGVLYARADYSGAIDLYRQAQEMWIQLFGRKNETVATSMSNIGSVLTLQGDYQGAIETLEEALVIRRELLGNNHALVADTLCNLSLALAYQGELSRAEQHIHEAMDIIRPQGGERHPRYAKYLFNLAFIQQKRGDLVEARKNIQVAYTTYRDAYGPAHAFVNRCLINLARLAEEEGNDQRAEELWKAAAESHDAARYRMSHHGLERAYFSSESSPLPYLAACLARNGKPLAAWERLEASLARGLLDDLTTRSLRPLSAEEQEQEISLIKELHQLDEQIGAITDLSATAGGHADQMEDLRQQREASQAELMRLENELTEKYGVIAGERYDLTRIQSRLSADQAILAWLDLDSQLGSTTPSREHWACLVRSTGLPVWVRIPGSGDNGAWVDKDEKLTEEVRRSLSRWRMGPEMAMAEQRLRQLHDQRIAPVKPQLSGIRHLIVLPAGKMAGIPVEALTDEFSISYAPAATMFAWLKEREHREEIGKPITLLALGDPEFSGPEQPARTRSAERPEKGLIVAMVLPDSSASRAGLKAGDVLLKYADHELDATDDLLTALAEMAQLDEQDKSDIPMLVWREGESKEYLVSPGKLGVAAAPLSAVKGLLPPEDPEEEKTRGNMYRPLPETREEVRSISDLFSSLDPDYHPTVLLGSDANEQRLDALALSGELGKYRFIHLATHGMMNDHAALQSSLILAQDQLPDSIDELVKNETIYDGKLTAEQILRTWRLNADLVTLSGCQTALGVAAGGEGYLGFSQALFMAGARSLLLSLWKVDDRATMLLMKRFYENILGVYPSPRHIGELSFQSGTKMNKVDALSEAKLWLRTEADRKSE
jgi:CHAT domain-containing protein/Flp pilus assembly protein TadD